MMLVATSCFWGDESVTRQITGNYYLNGESGDASWYLHFADEEWGLADALVSSKFAEVGFNDKCIVLRATNPGTQFYVIPLGKASDMESKVYVIPLGKASDTESREAARHKIIGPLSSAEFQITVRRLNNGALVPFDPELTSF
ncbi:MAG: hypothetical protein ACRYF0_20830 [Janthinobacterium lividum]